MIAHDAGQTEICGQPLTIVALSPYILDMMLALGVEPAGYAAADVTKDLLRRPKFDNPEQQIPYLGSRLNNQLVNLGDRHSPSLEAIAQMQPDLILGEGWQGTQGKYDLLSKIAPTVLVDDTKNGWQHSIEIVSKTLDKPEQLQQIKADYDAKVSAARTQLASVASKYSRVLMISSGSLSQAIYSYNDTVFSRLIEELNFQLVDIESVLSDNPTISFEVLPQLDTDIAIVIAWDDAAKSDTQGWKKLQQEWNSVPLLSQMPVSQAGRVFFLDARLSTIRGPVAAAAVLDSYLSFLTPLN
ncbi:MULTISPECIES: iron-siderophore ABC transporter substrate-binding protein [Cyanophyceae]|uniref:Iron-siderophore ABC transporter substrate-binding protein n=1 Tax=Leptolyngbya subtilissima DQ-A4 TaxID=2933933 RepID=A0ABV0K9C5_9CYAN|nr:iron-siderophore ABC transporter substrate-binding protein [Nodosilinea sp. FACHB-141]MBD2110308.1 iron-siderophore ABC transporter substrate-binding protein [Nodosilinea sp. FACHB-141]